MSLPRARPSWPSASFSLSPLWSPVAHVGAPLSISAGDCRGKRGGHVWWSELAPVQPGSGGGPFVVSLGCRRLVWGLPSLWASPLVCLALRSRPGGGVPGRGVSGGRAWRFALLSPLPGLPAAWPLASAVAVWSVRCGRWPVIGPRPSPGRLIRPAPPILGGLSLARPFGVDVAGGGGGLGEVRSWAPRVGPPPLVPCGRWFFPPLRPLVRPFVLSGALLGPGEAWWSLPVGFGCPASGWFRHPPVGHPFPSGSAPRSLRAQPCTYGGCGLGAPIGHSTVGGGACRIQASGRSYGHAEQRKSVCVLLLRL